MRGERGKGERGVLRQRESDAARQLVRDVICTGKRTLAWALALLVFGPRHTLRSRAPERCSDTQTHKHRLLNTN